MKLSGKHIAELREEILPDVCRLRGKCNGDAIALATLAEFFEEIAANAYLDANSPQIMKEAVSARTAFIDKNRTRLRSSIRRAKLTQRRLSALGGDGEEQGDEGNFTRISSGIDNPPTEKDANNNDDINDDDIEKFKRVLSPTSSHHANVIC